MKNIVGYVLALIGFVILALTVKPIQESVGITALSEFSSTTITFAGLIFIIIGVLFVVKGGSRKQPPEVPIYHGKRIVGYRRMK